MDQSVDLERAYWDAAAAKPLDELRAEIWNEPHIPNAWETRIEVCLNEIRQAIAPALIGGGAVLDLGCGVGRLALPVAEAFGVTVHVIGVDLSPRMVEIASHEVSRRRLRNVTFVTGDGRTVPLFGPFCAAYSMVTFQHLPREASLSYITQVGQRLVTGGRFRFQFVEGTEDAFLSHGLDAEEVVQTCEQAGLTVLACDRGRLYPNWTFITAAKESH